MKYIFLLFLVGCGAATEEAPAKNKYLKIDGYEDYVRDFQNESIVHLKPTVVDNLIIEEAIIEDKVPKMTILAKCYYNGYYGDGIPRIIIDPIEWEKSSSLRKRILMFHELAHCILKQQHRDDRPSIMNTLIVKDEAFKKKSDYYLDELFNPEKYTKKKKKQKKPVRGTNP